ncbi:MAG TPA: amidohydrolase family protein [Chloroflexota bacterium]|nr:amidohydrolase family protein [Chloroflexota bacterium]
MDRPRLDADSIYAEDGVIKEIGSGRAAADVIVDAKGTTVMPGLIDGHVHPTAGEYTPAQDAIGWLSNYVHGGTTTVVSAGELHHPGLPFEALTPELVLSIATVARQTIARLRPLGMHVEAGTLLLVPGLSEQHFDAAAAQGVRNVKFIFYDWSTGEPGEAEQYVAWAHQRNMTVKIHSGGVSRSGASVVAGYDIVHRIEPDVVGHISGGPIPMPDPEIQLTVRESESFTEICSSMNYRASLVALEALQEEDALDRLTLGTDTPGGTGVIPRGMLRNILFLSGVGGLDPALAIAAGTGNTARAHKLPSGRIEVGAPADLIVCDKIFGAAGTNALESMAKGDLPGIGLVIVDGRIRVAPRSQQTPPPMRPPVIEKKSPLTLGEG